MKANYVGDIINYIPNTSHANRLNLAGYYCENEEDLCSQLKSNDKTGLIYLQSLNNSSTSVEDIYNYLSKSNLNPSPKPVFFVNACYSACMSENNKSKNMLEFFLTSLAGAYIGILGSVGSSEAIAVAEKLFQGKDEIIDIKPAEILRDLRHDAAKELQQNPKNEDWHKLFYPFMYVYFGNPLAHLRLNRKYSDGESH